MAPQDKKPQPVTTLRCSRIKASIWKNEGMKGAFYNVTVARSYKDRMESGRIPNPSESQTSTRSSLSPNRRHAGSQRVGPLTLTGSLRPSRRGLPLYQIERYDHFRNFSRSLAIAFLKYFVGTVRPCYGLSIANLPVSVEAIAGVLKSKPSGMSGTKAPYRKVGTHRRILFADSCAINI
jgi:hypothetical protein